MSGNQKMLLLLLVVVGLGLGVTFRWILVLAALALIAIFHQPIWSALQYLWRLAVTFVFRKRAATPTSPQEPPPPDQPPAPTGA